MAIIQKEVGENMYSIEDLCYSIANREQYCTTCVIFNQIGQCTYLRQGEANANKATLVNVNTIDSEKLALNKIYRGDESCVCKKELELCERSW